MRGGLGGFVLLFSLLACASETPPPTKTQAPTLTSPPSTEISVTPSPQTAEEEVWNIYAPDPAHPWNRLHRLIFRRVDQSGQVFGQQALDPYFWAYTTHHRSEPSRNAAFDDLKDYSRQRAWRRLHDPLYHALMQRDLWAWLDQIMAGKSLSTMNESELEFAREIVRLIRAHALDEAQIQALPDSISMAEEEEEIFTKSFDKKEPSHSFLPPGIASQTLGWVHYGRADSPIAYSHVVASPFLGRSAFTAAIRVEPDDTATKAFLDTLIDPSQSAIIPPDGVTVALTRRAILLDKDGEMVPSPMVESLQMRQIVASGNMHPFEFIMDRKGLIRDSAKGLRALSNKEIHFAMFRAHPQDRFENRKGSESGHPALSSCESCHIERWGDNPIMGADSILSITRRRFPLPEGFSEEVISSSSEREALLTIEWKQDHESWKIIQSLWDDR